MTPAMPAMVVLCWIGGLVISDRLEADRLRRMKAAAILSLLRLDSAPQQRLEGTG
ncbi:hypothetical protein [Mesorhizobium sp. M5C.F.Cr.IN.023.01.1.1]|uniref:hypothetical protein n=1 Tax=Mesorhizobium sp. M5C.F.Cr.IN.023.01.1.1 TaxID=2496768 RepID=UPI0019D0F6AA|nr:hypothetical protein [Mesorhizobium sp. M5C.F.Cr.IN.023.01.1.1]